MRERRSGRLALGIVVLLILKFASELFDMYLIQFILQNVFQAGLIAVAIIFQPELRSALEKVGAGPLRLRNISDAKTDSVDIMINNMTLIIVTFLRPYFPEIWPAGTDNTATTNKKMITAQF